MGVSSEDMAPSPGGESVVSSKRGASPDTGFGVGRDAEAHKKKKIGPGSRGVANLTPEQLAKKRENGMSTFLLSLVRTPVFQRNTTDTPCMVLYSTIL